jgi:hypothetical protein
MVKRAGKTGDIVVAENSTERLVLKDLKDLFFSLLSCPSERIVHVAFDVGRA